MLNVILLRKLSISAPKLFSVTETGEPRSYIRMTFNFPWLCLNRVPIYPLTRKNFFRDG